MQISNSNVQATVVAKQTNSKPSANATVIVDKVGGQESSPSRQKKTQSKNDTDKALIYAYGVGARPNPAGRVGAAQSGSAVKSSPLDSAGQQTRNNFIRGKLVLDDQNFGVTKAINAYTNHQELDQGEQIPQVIGVDLYA